MSAHGGPLDTQLVDMDRANRFLTLWVAHAFLELEVNGP